MLGLFRNIALPLPFSSLPPSLCHNPSILQFYRIIKCLLMQTSGTHPTEVRRPTSKLFSFYHGHVIFEDLKIQIFYDRRHHLHALVLVTAFSLLKYFPTLLDFTGICVRTLRHNFGKLSVLAVTCQHFPSAILFAAANLIRKIVDIFRKGVIF